MLIEFRVENHRSIRDEQAITMEAGLVEDFADLRPRQEIGLDKKLLPVAALYGANASGKTNVLRAIDFMRDSVIQSHRSWAPDEGVPRSPFALGSKREQPSEYVACFITKEVRYEYGFIVNDEFFEEEWLFAWPQGRKQVWFERDASRYKFGDNFHGENHVTQKITRPNSLFLSAAVQNSNEQLKPIHKWFRDLRIHNVPASHKRGFAYFTNHFALAQLFDVEKPSTPSHRKMMSELLVSFRTLLKSADFGIVDAKAEYDEKKENSGRYKPPRFVFRHDSEGNEVWLPLEAESRGTQTLFRMALPILQVIKSGSILVIDELEASLHPMLAAQIVRQFNDPISNPNNAQLIFTTHDTNLLGTALGEPLLRRDQVWFTEKDKEGSTVLYPLTDYKPRKAENLERGYLQGRYGAIPFLGDLRFGKELR